MHFHRRTRQALHVAVTVTILALTGPAAAEDSCRTWLPDFAGCERSGRFDGFEKPISQAYLFEDPFITTGFAGYYIYHEFPDSSALGGGHVNAVALQARLAITDRLAFIATKDGYVWESPGSPLLSDRTGFMNLAAGLKYAFLQDREAGYIVSGIVRIEVPTGSSDIFEGGSGVQWVPSISGAWGPDNLNVIADLGGKVSSSNNYGSQIFYHLYADYEVHKFFQPFVQLSGISYVNSGNGSRPVRLKGGTVLDLDTVQAALGTGGFEGADLHNLGSRNMAGENIFVWALGTHVPITDHLTLSVAYERPFGDRNDIHKQRVTTAVVLEF